jgi:hypothetical protein
MFVNGSGQNVQSLERTFYRCFLPTLQVGIHILIFFLANLAKGNMSFCHHLVSIVCHPFTFHILIFSSENPPPNELKLGRKHLWKVPIRNKNCLWWPCLLTDRDKMSNLYRGPSIDASYQVSVHLAKRFQRRLDKSCLNC